MRKSNPTLTAGPAGGESGRYSLMEWVAELAGLPVGVQPPACTHPVLAVTADAAGRYLADPARQELLLHAGRLAESPPVLELDPLLAVQLGCFAAQHVSSLVSPQRRTGSEAAWLAALNWSWRPDDPKFADAVRQYAVEAVQVEIPHDAITVENLQTGEYGILAAYSASKAVSAAMAVLDGEDGFESEEDGLVPGPVDEAGLAGVYAVYAIACAHMSGGLVAARGQTLWGLVGGLLVRYSGAVQGDGGI